MLPSVAARTRPIELGHRHSHFVRPRFGAAPVVLRAAFITRRTASGRDNSSSCLDIQVSSSLNSSGGKRVLTGVASIRGQPREYFLALDIDFTIFQR